MRHLWVEQSLRPFDIFARDFACDYSACVADFKEDVRKTLSEGKVKMSKLRWCDASGTNPTKDISYIFFDELFSISFFA